MSKYEPAFGGYSNADLVESMKKEPTNRTSGRGKVMTFDDLDKDQKIDFLAEQLNNTNGYVSRISQLLANSLPSTHEELYNLNQEWISISNEINEEYYNETK